MKLTWMMCPRCHEWLTADRRCRTIRCAPLQEDTSYRRDVLDGNLYVAKEYLALGNTDENWAQHVQVLTAELAAFDKQMVEAVGIEGPAAKAAAKFKQ